MWAQSGKLTDKNSGPFYNRYKNGVWPGQMLNAEIRHGKVSLEDFRMQKKK
jgi:hypothetical protein